MEIFLLCSATGTAVRQTLAGTGSYEVEGGTVVSLYVVLYDFVLVFATKRFGICNKRSLDITKTNTEIGSLSWPVAMDSMCDISLLLSIAHGCLALPDASSISVRISIAKSVRNRLRTCLQPHGRLSHSHCSPQIFHILGRSYLRRRLEREGYPLGSCHKGREDEDHRRHNNLYYPVSIVETGFRKIHTDRPHAEAGLPRVEGMNVQNNRSCIRSSSFRIFTVKNDDQTIM